MKKYHKSYYAKNKTKILKKNKKWVKNHPFMPRKYVAKYDRKNREKKLKYIKDYHKRNRRKESLHQKRYYRLHPRLRKNRDIKSKYGITTIDYTKLLKKQKYKCAICRITQVTHKRKFKKSLFIDHCHKTNKVRGLLCDACNNGLGRFKDSVRFLKKAIKYLNIKYLKRNL